jgi:cytidylate kinase
MSELLKVFWEDIDEKGIKAKCIYYIERETYSVEVTKDKLFLKEEWKRRGYVPLYGIDVDDYDHSCRVAEKLAQEVEKELEI